MMLDQLTKLQVKIFSETLAMASQSDTFVHALAEHAWLVHTDTDLYPEGERKTDLYIGYADQAIE